MITGIGIGFLIGMIGLFWLVFLVDAYEWWHYAIPIGLCILTFIISMTIGGIWGKYEDKFEYKKFINSYISQKTIYEESLKDDKLSGLERINLINNISAINSELEEKKVEYKKWYYYYIDYSKIEELEKIKLGEDK